MALISLSCILFAGGRKIAGWRFCQRQVLRYLDLQLGSTFRNLSFGQIGTYFASCDILRKYVLHNWQSKEVKNNLPIGQLISHTSKKAKRANRRKEFFLQSRVVVKSTWLLTQLSSLLIHIRLVPIVIGRFLYFSGHVLSIMKSVTPNFFCPFGKSRLLPFCVASLEKNPYVGTFVHERP